MTEHSTIMGGSNCKQRIMCPGSFRLEKQMPKGEASDYAQQGSALHAAMEMLLTVDPEDDETLEAALNDIEGQDLGYGEDFAITRELIDVKVRPAWQAWQEIKTEYEIEDWFVELQVRPNIDSMQGCFGTLDILAIDMQKRLHFLDWKFGDGIMVDAEGNYQLGFYAGCTWYESDGEIEEVCEDASEDIIFHIVQPVEGANRVYNSWVTTIDWVEDLIEACVNTLRIADDPDAPIKPGDHCRFCRAKPICPAHAEMAIDALDTKAEGMTAVEIATALNMVERLDQWCRAVTTYAQTQAEAGVKIPGFKLVRKRSRRQWVDPDKAEQMLKNRRAKVDQMYDKKLKSPTQIEKVLPDLYSKTLSKLVHSPSSGLTLVPDNDPRDSVDNPMQLLSEALEKTQDAA